MIELTIIIPCRNEERYIEACLDSILGQDYPREGMEVLIIDGMSEDSTRVFIDGYRKRYPSLIRIIDNPDKNVSFALNLGIREARGGIVMRLDAHSVYPPDYVSKCVQYLRERGVDNVGGVLETVPGGSGAVPEAIALAMSSKFGVGGSYFRTGTGSPRLVDTVPFGCYRKEIFERIGYFDEDLVRNQDDEFNHRLINSGGRILLCPDIHAQYYARESIGRLWRMFYQYGYLKPLVALKVGTVTTGRQLMPSAFLLAFAFTGLVSIAAPGALWAFAAVSLLYLGLAALETARIARGSPGSARVLPLVFSVMHFAYGIGYIRGVIDFIVRRKFAKANDSDIPLTR